MSTKNTTPPTHLQDYDKTHPHPSHADPHTRIQELTAARAELTGEMDKAIRAAKASTNPDATLHAAELKRSILADIQRINDEIITIHQRN